MCRLLPLAVIAAAVAILGVPEAAAQVTCPQPKTMTNFQPTQYLGLWYEMKRVPREFEVDGECGTAQYSLVDESDLNAGINVVNTNFAPSTKQVTTVNLLAKPDDAPNGKLSVTFPNLPMIPPSPYWVLGTDYQSYAVVFSCSVPENAIVPHITLWVLSKNPSVYTKDVDNTVTKIIKDAGLDSSILRTVQHQQGCPTATCKSCSSPQRNLDVAKLKGRWWEVQHSLYSTDSDMESCNVVQVTDTSDGLTFNTTAYQMRSATDGVDKTTIQKAKWSKSDSKEGEFDIDGSGKLCVLETDYDNWAVVSICIPPTATTTPAPGPMPVPVPPATGGVYVLARSRGLSATQQMEANKAVVNAGIPAASMQATPSTPCPKAALISTNAGSATVAPAVLLLAALAAVLGRSGPAQ